MVEIYDVVKLIDKQQKGLADDGVDPLAPHEKAKVALFIAESRSANQDRAVALTINGLAEMVPYAVAFAAGGGITKGIEKGITTGARKR